jgi:hypothetical protein
MSEDSEFSPGEPKGVEGLLAVEVFNSKSLAFRKRTGIQHALSMGSFVLNRINKKAIKHKDPLTIFLEGP